MLGCSSCHRTLINCSHPISTSGASTPQSTPISTAFGQHVTLPALSPYPADNLDVLPTWRKRESEWKALSSILSIMGRTRICDSPNLRFLHGVPAVEFCGVVRVVTRLIDTTSRRSETVTFESHPRPVSEAATPSVGAVCKRPFPGDLNFCCAYKMEVVNVIACSSAEMADSQSSYLPRSS